MSEDRHTISCSHELFLKLNKIQQNSIDQVNHRIVEDEVLCYTTSMSFFLKFAYSRNMNKLVPYNQQQYKLFWVVTLFKIDSHWLRWRSITWLKIFNGLTDFIKLKFYTHRCDAVKSAILLWFGRRFQSYFQFWVQYSVPLRRLEKKRVVFNKPK
jgi:hypothetical protein